MGAKCTHFFNMKRKTTYTLAAFLLICLAIQAQTWSPCGGGFIYPPKALFADTISNKLYATGFGGQVDGMAINNIASWDGIKWDSLKGGANGSGTEFLIRYKDKLYLQKLDNIYAWDFTTQTWDSVPGGYVGGPGSVRAAVVFNNDLIIVGEFNRIGNVTARNVARFDGTNFYSIGSTNTSDNLRAVEIYNNEIYIAGLFVDTLHGGIAKWDGVQWIDVDQGVKGANQEIVTLKTYRGRLYAGGAFYGTKDFYSPSLAVWDGVKWCDIGGVKYNTWPWGLIYKLHTWGNKLLVCGNFDWAGDVAAASLALWNDTNWCSLNTNPDGQVWVSAIFQNKLYVGEHETLNGDSVHLIGYLNGGYNIGNCGAAVGINEHELKVSLKIYPNPTNSVLYIPDEEETLAHSMIEITNSLGQIVFQGAYTNSIDVSGLSPGCYFLNIRQSDKIILHSKFIKE